MNACNSNLVVVSSSMSFGIEFHLGLASLIMIHSVLVGISHLLVPYS